MITVKNLTKVYKTKGRNVTALNNVSFTLPESGMVFIVGKSGSGKSTLLNMISGLDKFTSGKIIAGGNSLSKMSIEEHEKYLSSYIGYIFQDYRLIEDFTVRQNVELAADISESGKPCYKYLRDVGLEGYEDRLPRELSGGQKQRVAIARALIKSPKVILADEPTGNLDKTTTKEILQLLKRISKEKLVLIVSHNLRDADEYADRIIELSDGRVVRDESRVPGYKNKFSYENGVINLPHHKDLQYEEIGEVLRRSKYAKGIVQNTSGFLPTEEDIPKGKRTKLHNKGMSLRNLVKIFSIFFKRKIFSKVTTVFLAAVILSVFYVIQALTLYNTNTALLKTLDNTDAYGVIVQTSHRSRSTDKLVGHLPDEKIAALDEVYDGGIYRLYSEYLYTNNFIGGENFVTSPTNLVGFYGMMTYGTLNTTKEYAAKVLGVSELELLAGELDTEDYGVVITDYTADSIINNSRGRYKTYEDIIGEYTAYREKTYINGIVNTNYEEEHFEIKNVLLSLTSESNITDLLIDQRFINFLSDASERYHIAYNFSDRYEEALREYDMTRGLMRTSVFFVIDKATTSSANVDILVDTENRYDLGDGEIAMGFTLYKNKLNGKATEDVIPSFSPRKITMAQYESQGVTDIANSMDLTITKLIPSSTSIYVNENTYRELFDFNVFTYSVYLDDPGKADGIVSVVEGRELEIYSGKVGNVYYIERCVSVFKNFFDITMALILVACVFFLVNFGVKSIRSNIYEIGVIKAMGGIRRDISKIFISQSLVMGIGILIVTYFGMQLGAYVADNIFLASLEAVVDGEFYGIRAIDFYPDVAVMDIGIAMAVVVVSAIISTKSIDKLNLISILKAKE